MTRDDEVMNALRSVIDPELGIDIVNLGLIYASRIDGDDVHVDMTLTVPGCPMHQTIARDVERALRTVAWVRNVDVRMTFEPPWAPERLSPLARMALGR